MLRMKSAQILEMEYIASILLQCSCQCYASENNHVVRELSIESMMKIN